MHWAVRLQGKERHGYWAGRAERGHDRIRWTGQESQEGQEGVS